MDNFWRLLNTALIAMMLGLIVMAAIGGCGKRERDPLQIDVMALDGFRTGWVKEITLSDGTKCAVARALDKAISISCDWGKR